MIFEIKPQHTRLTFPSRISFGKPWYVALDESLGKLEVPNARMKVLLVHSPSQGGRIRNNVAQLGMTVNTAVYKRCDDDSVIDLDVLCAKSNINILVAMGGGNVIDLCKLVAMRRKMSLITIPTSLSSDCIASPISVMQMHDGKKVSYPGAIPNEIVIDDEILASAPERLLLSGIGDLISNNSALLELEEKKKTGHEVNDFALLMSETALLRFLSIFPNIENPAELNVELAKGLVLSGMAMGFSGDSSPCSGSEHLISHALDAYTNNDAMHGEQVGVATLYVDALRGVLGMQRLEPKAVAILRDYCQYNPDLLKINKSTFMMAVENTSNVRLGRSAFWDRLNIKSVVLENAYDLAFE